MTTTGDINKQLDQYSKISYDSDLDTFENDVMKRLIKSHITHSGIIKNIERLFGMPISFSGGYWLRHYLLVFLLAHSFR